MSTNTYEAATSDTQASLGRTVRIFSPTQVAFGTIGGPVGLIYFLWANFSALGNSSYARKTLILGAAGTFALIPLLPLLPDKGTGTAFTVLYVVLARHVAEKHQMTKAAIADTAGYSFQSNWRVLGLGLTCLVASIVVAVATLVLLQHLGAVRL